MVDHRKKAIAAISLLFLINVTFNFEAAMVEFLIPVVSEELGIPIEYSQRILYLYYVAIISTLAISLTSRLSILTRLSGLTIGSFVFAGGSLLLAANIGIAYIVAGRLLQGAGVALIVSVTPALITHWRLGEHLRISPFTIIPVSIGVGMLSGPSIGALALQEAGLPSTLLGLSLVILCATIALSLTWTTQPVSDLPPAVSPGRWDFGGLLAVTLILWAMILLSQTFSGDVSISFSLPFTLGLIGASILLIKRSDERSDHPVLDIQFLYHDTKLYKSLIMSVLSFAATYVVAYVLPFYIYYEFLSQGVELYLGGTIVFVPLGFVLGPLVFETMFRPRAEIGFWASAVFLVIALVCFFLAEISKATIWLLTAGATLGIARGIFVSPYNQVTLGQVAAFRIDETSTYNAIARYVGMALGILAGAYLVVTTSNLGNALQMALLIGLLFIALSISFIRSICKCEV